MKNKCIYTAIFDDYENLFNPYFIEDDVDYICFTNNKDLKSDIWKIIYVERGSIPAPLFYKRFKCLSHEYLNEYDYTIWIDANFQIKIKNYFNYMLSYLKDDILLYQHFCLGGMHRDCIYTEARFSIGLPKYSQEPIKNQLIQYRHEGYPEHNGLYQSGFILRKNNENVVKFNKLWYDEICKWSVNIPQCQVSLPYCLWKSKAKFNVVNDDIIWNPEIYHIHNHKFNKVIHDNCILPDVKEQKLSKKYKHILIFGNDHTINDFPFEKLKDTDLITAGVNRIWKKYDCDYLYAMDRKIIHELYKNSHIIPSTFLYPDYMMNNPIGNYDEFEDEFKTVIPTCKNAIKTNDYSFPHQSVTWLIQTLEDIYKDYKCKFYIYGVSLKWHDKHHFWVGDKTVTNTKDKAYHLPIFDLYFNGFKNLRQQSKSQIISVSKDSRLNQIFPYTEIDSLLKRRLK